MKTNLGLFGGGKMARAVEHVLSEVKIKNKMTPFLQISRQPSSFFSLNATDIDSIENDILADIDVWIDFTSGKGLIKLLAATQKFKTPVVSGSTGFTESEFNKLKAFSKSRQLFWSSNMSPGLWAFRQALKSLKSISNFDFAIEEIHHSQKKDKPSGTAKTLQSDLEKTIGKKINKPLSQRLGGVFGIHTVIAASSNEIITMQHQVLNRTVFAEGAILAGDWLIKQRAGFYTMDDLFLKNTNGR